MARPFVVGIVVVVKRGPVIAEDLELRHEPRWRRVQTHIQTVEHLGERVFDVQVIESRQRMDMHKFTQAESGVAATFDAERSQRTAAEAGKRLELIHVHPFILPVLSAFVVVSLQAAVAAGV